MMHPIFRMALIVIYPLIITGCGGGSSSGNGGGQEATFSLTPSSINLVIGEGESQQFSVNAIPNVNFSGTVYIYIIDRVGVIQPSIEIIENVDDSYTATLTTDTTLSAGTHSGNFQIRTCKDLDCNSHYAGSPMSLPYTFEIMATTNLTTLQPWTGVAAWETFQRENSHSGYVPITLNAESFTPRWRWQVPDGVSKTINPVVASNGRVYVAVPSTTPKLFALNETDSSEAWNHDFGSVNRLNDPAVSGGNIYVATSGHGDTAMWSFTADTGNQRFNTAFGSQWESYYAPVVDNGFVYTNGGYYGGLNAFDISNGDSAWFTKLDQYDEWSPALDASYLYTYVGGVLNLIDKSTGTVVNSIYDSGFDWKGWSMSSSPIVGSQQNILTINQATSHVTGNELVSFDTVALNLNWTVSGIYNVHPALANGVVYIANNSPFQLEARNESTGQLLWSWTPADLAETGFAHNVIATDNLVFLSTNERVHAIDITTQESVWTYWRPGNLAMSNSGILYVAVTEDGRSNGTLTAINLQ